MLGRACGTKPIRHPDEALSERLAPCRIAEQLSAIDHSNDTGREACVHNHGDADKVKQVQEVVQAPNHAAAEFLDLMASWSNGTETRELENCPSTSNCKCAPTKPGVGMFDPDRPEKKSWLTKAQIKEIQERFPRSGVIAPPEAEAWAKRSLEIFLGSNGLLRPPIDLEPQVSPCLAQFRQKLAMEGFSRAPSEYLSFCRHIVDRSGDILQLPIAETMPVARGKKLPEDGHNLKAPLLVETRRSWRPKSWVPAFWSYECGEAMCRAFTRYPPMRKSETRSGSSTGAYLDTRIDEFTKYMSAVQDVDPQCREDSSMACPRFFAGGFRPFASGIGPARSLWEQDLKSGRKLWSPSGLQDLTERWCRKCCTRFDLDFHQVLASFDCLQFGPAGAVCRLHVQNSNSHIWYGQIQGRRAFILFSPAETCNLYPDICETEAGSEQRRQCSPVDVFHPNDKHYPKFKHCKAQAVILEPGEILVVPQGWWMSSVTLESSTTLARRFWNRTNRRGICDEFAQLLKDEQSEPMHAAFLTKQLDEIYDQIQEDDASGDED